MKIAVILILLGQAYISWRTFKILSFPVWGKWVVALLMLMALVALILRFVRQFQGMSSLLLDTVLYDVGTSWLVVLLYLVLAFAVMDIGVAYALDSEWIQPPFGEGFDGGVWCGVCSDGLRLR